MINVLQLATKIHTKVKIEIRPNLKPNYSRNNHTQHSTKPIEENTQNKMNTKANGCLEKGPQDILFPKYNDSNAKSDKANYIERKGKQDYLEGGEKYNERLHYKIFAGLLASYKPRTFSRFFLLTSISKLCRNVSFFALLIAIM